MKTTCDEFRGERRGVGLAARRAALDGALSKGWGWRPCGEAQVVMKKWNVLVYLAGDNDLASAALRDINEMESVGSGRDVDIVVQVDIAPEPHARSAHPGSTRRYYVTKDSQQNKINSKLLDNLGETNTGDPAVVCDFLKEALDAYPAERTMLVLWNHGSGFYVPEGWVNTEGGPSRGELRSKAQRMLKRAFFNTSKQEILSKPRPVRGILYDDGTSDCLDNKELKSVLRYARDRLAGRKVEVLGMDACLMTMIEVAYQLKDSARYLVGSEESEPNEGWPYGAILGDLTARPDMAGDELGKVIVDRYIASYVGATGVGDVTQSALDLSALGDLTSALKGLAHALLERSGDQQTQDAVQLARLRATDFYDGLYVDIHDFAGKLAARAGESDVGTACKGVVRAIEGDGVQTPILAERHAGPHMNTVKGLSIYWPLRKMPSSYYGELDFAKDTRWGDVLKAYGAD